MPANYFNFFTEIEEYFIRKRGKNLLVSPLDWCLIEVWKEHGIPLHVVLRGIDRSFESAAGRSRRPPTTLHYCHPAVMEAFEEYQQATLGSHPDTEEAETAPGLSRERLAEFVGELRRRVAAGQSEASQQAAARLEALESEIRGAQSIRLETLDVELAEIRRTLVAELSDQLSAERLEEIRREAQQDTKAYKKRLSAEMYGRLLEKHVEAKLASLFELPDFSLMQLE